MNILVNGKIMVNGKEFWRLDNTDKMAAGIDFLQNPWALVADRDDAERIVSALAKEV